MKALLIFCGILTFITLYLSSGTYPDVKFITLMGMSFGVNINDYLLLKLMCVSSFIIYLYLKYINKNGSAS